MNVRRLLLPVALLTTISSSTMLGAAAFAQEAVGKENEQAAADPDRVPIFTPASGQHPSQSSTERLRMVAKEMRMARAIYRVNQRVARMEHNLWMGHEPLRPRWNSVPMMSSRYSNPRFYVPVYMYNR